MQRIASFEVDHTRLKPGLYVSRTDGDVVTYDLRFVEPNAVELLMPPPALHTMEHLFATLARNSALGDQVVYFGPMGCRSGCYLLLRDSVSPQQAIDLCRQTLAAIAVWEGPIPGASAAECGNYREHDLAAAQIYARGLLHVLASWTPEKLTYPA